MQENDCLFCKIARGEIPSTQVFSNERIVAFKDIHPKAPTHLLVVPRKHIASLYEATEEDRDLLGEMLLVASQLAKESPNGENGGRFGFNCGPWGGQEVGHLHLHVLAGKKL